MSIINCNFGRYLSEGNTTAMLVILKVDSEELSKNTKNKLKEKYPEMYSKYFEVECNPVSLSGKVAFDKWVAKKYLMKIKNAEDRGLEFSLTLTSIKNILRAKKCYYTGLPLTPETVTIDRVDSSIGYCIGNTVACHTKINNLKAVFEGEGTINDKQLKVFLTKWINRL